MRAAVNVLLHGAGSVAGSTGAGTTVPLKNKLSFYNRLTLGCPDLKSRLREAVSVPHPAGTGRPRTAGTEGIGTAPGRG